MSPIALLILAALGQGPAAAPAVEWKPIKPADGSFQAEMPAEPKLRSQQIPTEQGPFQRDTYTAKGEGAMFGLQATRFSVPIPAETREASLERSVEDYIASSHAEVIRRESIKVDGRPGWDLTIRSPVPGGKTPGVILQRGRFVISTQTLYFLSAASPVDRPLPEEITSRFLRSFRFEPRPSVTVLDSTPEEALRTFMQAVIARDDVALGAVSLPAEGLDKLLEGEAISPARFAAARLAMMATPIKALKVGDEFALPGVKGKQSVPADDIADDRAVLLLKTSPVPTRLRKIDGKWKVDPRPLISARKAADAARAKAAARKAGG